VGTKPIDRGADIITAGFSLELKFWLPPVDGVIVIQSLRKSGKWVGEARQQLEIKIVSMIIGCHHRHPELSSLSYSWTIQYFHRITRDPT
jgi:hypothetical protein